MESTMKPTMKSTMRPLLLAFAFVLVALSVSSCHGLNCSPCPIGMHVSDPTRKCSACVANDDRDPRDAGVDDASDAQGDDAEGDNADGGTLDASGSGSDAASDIVGDAADVDGPGASTDSSPPDTAAEAPVDMSGPEAAPICSLFPNIGCFTGATCASTRVDAVCVNGTWTCPTGASSAELCPPDAGADADTSPDAVVDANAD
jgi:hypothetical protein